MIKIKDLRIKAECIDGYAPNGDYGLEVIIATGIYLVEFTSTFERDRAIRELDA